MSGKQQAGCCCSKAFGQGEGPKLACLAVDNNILDNAAMGFLATGDWPMLQTLRLHGNDINVQGLRLLSAGQWPQLCKLMLDGSAISIATWTLLNLSWFALPALIIDHGHFTAPRNVTSTFEIGHVFWPKLAEVQFASHRTRVPAVQLSSLRVLLLFTLACLTLWVVCCRTGQVLT